MHQGRPKTDQNMSFKIGLLLISKFFSIYVFCGEAAKKNKYRWFKVERFGGGGGW